MSNTSDAPMAKMIGLAVRARRRELDMTQSELAERTGCSKPQICRFETYRRANLTVSFLERMAHALDTTVAELVRQAEGRRFVVHGEAQARASHIEAEAEAEAE